MCIRDSFTVESGELVPLHDQTIVIYNQSGELVHCSLPSTTTYNYECGGHVLNVEVYRDTHWTFDEGNRSAYGYGYIPGYGYGYWNFSWGWGYGYGYGNGILYSGAGDTTLKYRIGWSIPSDYAPGVYSVKIIFDAEGINYTAFTSFNVQETTLPAYFTGYVNTTAVDSDDNDTLYDFIEVRVGIYVNTPGFYRSRARLDAREGFPHMLSTPIGWRTNGSTLSKGINYLTLLWSGEEINRMGKNGPYFLKYLRLYNSNWIMLDSLQNVGDSPPYNFTEFESQKGSILGKYSDFALDSDGDSHYNYLVVNVSINISTRGRYLVRGLLTSNTSSLPIVHAKNLTYLNTPGEHVVQLYFDGLVIRNRGEDGPYMLRYVELVDRTHGLWKPLDRKVKQYTTLPYNASNFEAPDAHLLVDQITSKAIDANSNGKFDYLTIEVNVSVEQAGYYRLSGKLVTLPPRHTKWEHVTTYLKPGNHTLELRYDGMQIYNTHKNGPYQLRKLLLIKITDTGWVPLDIAYRVHNTYNYSYTDFEVPYGGFTGEFSENVLDVDKDGKYDWLVIRAGVNITRAGRYRIRGELYSIDNSQTVPKLKHMLWAKVDYWLNESNVSVELPFEGTRIRSTGINGPYLLHKIVLIRIPPSLSSIKAPVFDERNPLDREIDVLTTSNYSYLDFDQPLAEFADPVVIDSQPLMAPDADEDGLYDALNLSVRVIVNEPGVYRVIGLLTGKENTFVTKASIRKNLSSSAQAQNLDLVFDGIDIRTSEIDGPYHLAYVELRHYEGINPSSESYEYHVDSTGKFKLIHWLFNAYNVPLTYHNHTQFELPPAQLTGEYKDNATDVNKDGFYDYLSIFVGLNVSENGTYILQGKLMGNLTFIALATTKQNLSPGIKEIELKFKGRAIRRSGVDGNYTLRKLKLYRFNGWQASEVLTLLDSKTIAYVTSEYKHDEFR